MQALILAGGLGTRLREVVGDRPKVLAPVGGRPFLVYLLDQLRRYGIIDIILSVGYQAERVMEVVGDGSGLGVQVRYAREESLLGTGGALRNALSLMEGDDILVLNGDSYFDLNFDLLTQYHRLWDAGVTIALKYRSEMSRYGMVELASSQALTLISRSREALTPDPSPKGRGEQSVDVRSKKFYRVAGFREKPEAVMVDGYINGGAYLIRRERIAGIPEGISSLEKEILSGWVDRGDVYGLPWGGRFIDIGVPEDYRRACAELEGWVKKPKVGALFLDRDGVINEDLGYVWRKEEVRLICRTIEMIRQANLDGVKAIVLTNQAGVARGYYSEEDVRALHEWLGEELAKRDARVDGWIYCPHHPEGTVAEYRRSCLCRKPLPGMVLQAAEAWGIAVERSRMVGDKESDRIRLPYLESEISSSSSRSIDNG